MIVAGDGYPIISFTLCMPFGFIDQELNLVFRESVHQLPSLCSNVGLRVCVKDTLDVKLSNSRISELT